MYIFNKPSNVDFQRGLVNIDVQLGLVNTDFQRGFVNIGFQSGLIDDSFFSRKRYKDQIVKTRLYYPM